MLSSNKIQHSVTDLSSKPKKINRSDKTPIYADEITEIKMNSHTTRLTFGALSADESDSTHTLVNESVTVVMPTTTFLSAISQMFVPILENEQLLEVLIEDYSNIAEHAKHQLEQLKSPKK